MYYFGESASGTPPSENELKRLDISNGGLVDPADIHLIVAGLAPKPTNAEGELTAVVAQPRNAVGEEEDLDALLIFWPRIHCRPRRRAAVDRRAA